MYIFICIYIYIYSVYIEMLFYFSLINNMKYSSFTMTKTEDN